MIYSPEDVKFFKNQNELRKWLIKNHQKKDELWIGFYHKKSGKPTVTYKQAVDEALCFGWIDGIRKKFGEDSFVQRYTPRRPKSKWSKINIARVNELKEMGLMQPAGLKAFKENENSSVNYSYEVPKYLTNEYQNKFKMNKAAWKYFENQPPHYKRTASFWVMDAKREETRLKRLETLIADSEEGVWIKLLRRK